MHNNKSKIIHLIIVIFTVFIILFGIIIFNQYFLMRFTKGVRMVLMIVNRWLLLLAPGISMLMAKEKLRNWGLTKERILNQVITGIIIAIFMSAILTVVPILLGFKDMVGSTSYTQPWQFVYEFVYTFLGVALVEELVFRGYVFNKLLNIRDSRWFAIIVSSIIFGFFHIFSGNIIQIFVTGFIGFIYCMCREKIKGCTLISLIVAHGLYDGMIVLWIAHL